MSRTVKAVQADLAAARQGQAEASSNADRFRASARANADSAALFARWSGKASREAERLTVFQEREAALLAELPEAQRREALETHKGEVGTCNAESQALAVEWRDYEKMARKLVSLCQRTEANEAKRLRLHRQAKELRSNDFPGPGPESIARPSRIEKRRVFEGVKPDVPDVDFSGGLTPDMMAGSHVVERVVHFPSLRDNISLPDFEGGKPLWSGALIKY